jgi:hypothetical protein
VTAPTAPSPALPTQQVPPLGNANPAFSVAEVTLSGVVFELTPTGRVPIEGVGVSNGEGEYAVTDASGVFSLRPVWVCPCSAQPWIDAGITLLWLWTDDYVDPPGQPPSLFTRGMTNPGPGWRDVMINGDTRVELELVRR